MSSRHSTAETSELQLVGLAAEVPAPDVLDPQARSLISVLERSSRSDRSQVLAARRECARRVRAGHQLSTDAATAAVREDDSWTVRPAPAEVAVRQVELATPATAEHARTALASSADVWVADLEDSLVPTWDRLVAGYRVLSEASADRQPGQPVLMVRPRGLHLQEWHLRLDGEPVAASVADVAIVLAGQAHTLVRRGSTPHLYLPKIESAREARWWEALLSAAEEHLGLEPGTVRVSVLVETVTAVYELEEILYALRERVTALTAGRWDYIFSHLRTYGTLAEHVLPDLESFTMNTRFLRCYTDLIVRVCQRRGAQAIGGPVAMVPGGPFDDVTLQAQARVLRDKAREARSGFQGAWVLHAAQVGTARAAFAAVEEAPRPRPRGPVPVDGATLADASGVPGSATLTGLRRNLRGALSYLTGWLAGEGCTVIEGQVQDIGTVELARLQTWQWAHHRIRVAEGPQVTRLLLDRMLAQEVAVLQRRVGDDTLVRIAETLLVEAITAEEPPAFLSISAYAALMRLETERCTGRGRADPAA